MGDELTEKLMELFEDSAECFGGSEKPKPDDESPLDLSKLNDEYYLLSIKTNPAGSSVFISRDEIKAKYGKEPEITSPQMPQYSKDKVRAHLTECYRNFEKYKLKNKKGIEDLTDYELLANPSFLFLFTREAVGLDRNRFEADRNYREEIYMNWIKARRLIKNLLPQVDGIVKDTAEYMLDFLKKNAAPIRSYVKKDHPEWFKSQKNKTEVQYEKGNTDFGNGTA